MSYESRENKIKRLRQEIKEARKDIEPLRDKMVDGGFKIEDIKNYNKASTKISKMQSKLKHTMHFNKPIQYMEELRIPNNIIF
jgi:predicted  nucleic acid-binding Zn-ribbon protein